MKTLAIIASYYIQGSLACSFLAVIISIVVAITMKDPLPRYVIVLSRMMMIFILSFTLMAVGFAAGIVYMSWIKVPGTTGLSYQPFGGLGMMAGALLGVTLGWLYAFWPLIRPTPKKVLASATQPQQ